MGLRMAWVSPCAGPVSLGSALAQPRGGQGPGGGGGGKGTGMRLPRPHCWNAPRGQPCWRLSRGPWGEQETRHNYLLGVRVAWSTPAPSGRFLQAPCRACAVLRPQGPHSGMSVPLLTFPALPSLSPWNPLLWLLLRLAQSTVTAGIRGRGSENPNPSRGSLQRDAAWRAVSLTNTHVIF